MLFGKKVVGVSTLQDKLNAEKPPCSEQPLWMDLNDGVCADAPTPPTMRLFGVCETGAVSGEGECYWNQPTIRGFGVP